MVFMIVEGIESDASTMMVGTMLGRMYRTIRERSDSLNAAPVSTKAMFFKDCVLARTVLAYDAQLTTAMAMMTFVSPLPSTVMTAMDMMMGGMDQVRSPMNDRKRSRPPP